MRRIRWPSLTVILLIAGGLVSLGCNGGTESGGRGGAGGAVVAPACASGGGGSGGADGGPTYPGCPETTTAPASGLIADFSLADGGNSDGGVTSAPIEIGGGIYLYGGPAAPQSAFSNGSLHITERGAAGTTEQFAGLVLYFNDCVDASAFSGISFSISGSFSGCTMQYAANFSEDEFNDGMSDPKGTCTLGESSCYPPSAAITTVTATPQTMMFTWGAVGGGMPDSTVDPAKITGVEWEFTIAAAPTGTCTADLTIGDVQFYK
jgi:hypothetical protein